MVSAFAGRGALARVVGLAAVEGARIKLAPLTMRHPLLDRSALQQQVLRHYTRAVLNEGYKVLASVDILGADPIAGQLSQRSRCCCSVTPCEGSHVLTEGAIFGSLRCTSGVKCVFHQPQTTQRGINFKPVRP
jgi:hypothetical protein